MSIALSAILLMVFIIIYSALVNIYSILFRITGLTKEKSNFQVISLLTGCGFTTAESEIVTQDKTRRRIAKAAMITGYAFSVIIVSLIMNLIISMKGEIVEETYSVIIIAFIIFVLYFILSKLPFIERPFERLIENMATYFLTRGKNRNIITLLDKYSDDAIVEVYINELPEFLEHKTLVESGIKDTYHMNVLMVKRNNKVIDVSAHTVIQKKDRIVIFGNYQNIKDVFKHTKLDITDIVEDANKENVIELIDNYGLDAMAKITVNNLPEFMENKILVESGLKDKYSINVMMITRGSNVVEVTANTIIKQYDEIVVFGPYNNIKNIFLKH